MLKNTARTGPWDHDLSASKTVATCQAGNATRAAYGLKMLLDTTQRQISLDAANSAKGSEQSLAVLSRASHAGAAALLQGVNAKAELSKEKKKDLPFFLKSAELFDTGAPKLFNYEWTHWRTSVAGVNVEANLLSVAPCGFLTDANGFKDENTLLKTEPILIHVDPQGWAAEASLIEVAPSLIKIVPFGHALSIELPGHIHIEDALVGVSPKREEEESGPGASEEGASDSGGDAAATRTRG
ncbi:hypothetical protein WJX81_002057 [Elliptochloris bilobata]|uniref:Uncharacterized protein n=1 Tax=Elliptochloris bilobata TaxID=381761 RepID=A0AAW1RS84_9CHLO